MQFEKWQGLGNDFVLIEQTEVAHAGGRDELPTELVRALCDRHFGIGADGVLVFSGSAADGGVMVVRNADGSRPEMCGNGLRCVAALLAERASQPHATLLVRTDAGPRRCRVEARAAGSAEVEVDMGVARVGAPLRWQRSDGGRTVELVSVDVGNPHAVAFDELADADFDAMAAALDAQAAHGTNVEIARWDEGQRSWLASVWERGVGRTLACGTGACAVAAAAVASGRSRAGEPVRVRLPGGVLEVRVDAVTGGCLLRGVARRVFRGTLGLDALDSAPEAVPR